MTTFTALEQKILNRIQRDIKITADPLGGLADETGIDREIFLSTIKKLKDDKIVRDISGIFNADRLGYESSLIAMEVPEQAVESAAAVINNHPGVSHNYLRGNRYNIWFTLAVRGSELEEEAGKIASACGALDYLILRNEKLFKIGLLLKIGDEEDQPSASFTGFHRTTKKTTAKSLKEEEKKIIFILQEDLPLEEKPFDILIEKYNIDVSVKKIIKTAVKLKKRGIMRRYSAVLRHHRAGYTSNAMTAWKIGGLDRDSKAVGEFSSIPNISHLYQRTVYPGKWEYPLFAMIHAQSENELNDIIKNLEIKTGTDDYLVLKTIKEYKKKRIKYFSDMF